MHLPQPLPFTPGYLRLAFRQKALTFLSEHLTHLGQSEDTEPVLADSSINKIDALR